jgi:hypothetical protein
LKIEPSPSAEMTLASCNEVLDGVSLWNLDNPEVLNDEDLKEKKKHPQF